MHLFVMKGARGIWSLFTEILRQYKGMEEYMIVRLKVLVTALVCGSTAARSGRKRETRALDAA